MEWIDLLRCGDLVRDGRGERRGRGERCGREGVYFAALSSPDFHAAICAFKALARGSGKSFPRAADRRRIPSHARWLKKYFARRGPVRSKMSDNPHTASPLGDCAGELVHSGELNVKSPVGDRIPEFPNLPEEQPKVSSAVGR